MGEALAYASNALNSGVASSIFPKNLAVSGRLGAVTKFSTKKHTPTQMLADKTNCPPGGLGVFYKPSLVASPLSLSTGSAAPPCAAAPSVPACVGFPLTHTVRFPDPTANPYLAFAAMLMAGLDGIINKIDPGPAMDKDLYDLPPKELKKIPTVCGSLREALQNLDKDRAFLKAGGVFNDDFIDSYIELKMQDVMRFEMTPHPVEFDMYYSV